MGDYADGVLRSRRDLRKSMYYVCYTINNSMSPPTRNTYVRTAVLGIRGIYIQVQAIAIVELIVDDFEA